LHNPEKATELQSVSCAGCALLSPSAVPISWCVQGALCWHRLILSLHTTSGHDSSPSHPSQETTPGRLTKTTGKRLCSHAASAGDRFLAGSMHQARWSWWEQDKGQGLGPVGREQVRTGAPERPLQRGHVGKKW